MQIQRLLLAFGGNSARPCRDESRESSSARYDIDDLTGIVFSRLSSLVIDGVTESALAGRDAVDGQATKMRGPDGPRFKIARAGHGAPADQPSAGDERNVINKEVTRVDPARNFAAQHDSTGCCQLAEVPV